MSLGKSIAKEIQHEAAKTRKLLERVPFDNPEWAPHEKSMHLGRLATHIAELYVWIPRAITADEFDFLSTAAKKPHVAANTEELLSIHDDKVAKAVDLLENVTDEELNKPWRLLRAGQLLWEKPKKDVIRDFSLNHLIHHRGQLSVYLRLNEVPVVGMYGPSADEK